jgi:competence protein ComEC
MYPALRVSLLYVAGILASHVLFGTLPSTASLFLLMVLPYLLLLVLFLFRVRHTTVVTPAAALLCVGMGMAREGVERTITGDFPSAGVESLAVAGMIVDPPVQESRRARFVLRPDERGEIGTAPFLGSLLAVTVTARSKDPPLPGLAYGMHVMVRGSVRLPQAQRNPGEFDLRRYYEANGIGFVMRVRSTQHLRVVRGEGGSALFRELVLPVRGFILSHIDRMIGGEEGEYLKGILVGVRSGISRETREAFVNAGVAHILAVSGSNVAVIALTLYVLFGALRVPRCVLEAIVAAGLLFYMLLTGSQPPVVRATIMALVFLFGRMFEHRVNTLNSLGLAGVIILFIDPRQLFDVGFQLSFGAVFSIILLYPKANRCISSLPLHGPIGRGLAWILRLSALSLVASLGTLPLTASYFEKVSVIGLLANIVVVPAAGASVVLGVIAVVAETFSKPVAEAYAAVNWLLLHWTLVLTKEAGSSPVAFLQTSGWGFVDTIPYLAGVALLFTLDSPGARRKMLILFLVTANLHLYVRAGESWENEDNLIVTVLDVGQGDAIVIRLPGGRTMVIDAGPRIRDYDAGERIVAPYLRRLGISRIDLLVLTHPHNDHVGGAGALCRNFEVGSIICGGPLPRDTALSAGGLVGGTEAGTMLSPSADARIYVLSPGCLGSSGHPRGGMRGLNNSSLVLKLQFGSTSFHFTGDMERPVEESVVELYGEFLRASVLKVAHHGAGTGTSARFLDSVQPDHAVISVGMGNSFKHPSQVVVERIQRRGSAVARTDRDGAVIFESDGAEVHRVAWR